MWADTSDYILDGQLQRALPIPGAQATGEPPLGWSTTSTHAIGGPARPFLPDAHWILSRSCENLLDPRASCNRGREASRRYGQ